ncbi:hypothetical protein PROFUN_13554 [Planoprotostelium fungivorum]|uniref:Uncharacterized protein n=1 Tax=Planoprotostelium fungivorum TaxID=1890364 RepID=A0A2P6N3R7_9EUKA|nr:hypothetical protein PROFUN_13554 [Planoprotostelium fungivorum]
MGGCTLNAFVPKAPPSDCLSAETYKPQHIVGEFINNTNSRQKKQTTASDSRMLKNLDNTRALRSREHVAEGSVIEAVDPLTTRILSQHAMKASDLKEQIIKYISDHRLVVEACHEREIVRPATSDEPPVVISDKDTVEVIAGEVLDYWRRPSAISAVVASGFHQMSSKIREMAVDMASPLCQSLYSLRKGFGITESVVCKHLPDRVLCDPSRLISFNCNFAPTQLLQTGSGMLVLMPLSLFSKLSYSEASDGCEKEGVMYKSSANAKGKTSKKKRNVILRDNVLLYYASKEDKSPCGIIPCEYYSVHLDEKGSIVMTKGNFELNLKTRYVLAPAEESTVQDWLSRIQDKCVPGGDTKVFGVGLAPLLSRYTGEAINPIPVVMRKTTSWLDNYGLDVEGIFRMSGVQSQLEDYKRMFDKGKVFEFGKPAFARDARDTLPETDAHTVAGLFKLYLRELPEPLITYELYDDFIQMASEADHQKKVQRAIELVHQLPEVNRVVLRFISNFLSRVAKFSEINKMTPSNLAIVFSPNMLRCALLLHLDSTSHRLKGHDPMKVMRDSSAANDVVVLFITEDTRIFRDVGVTISKRRDTEEGKESVEGGLRETAIIQPLLNTRRQPEQSNAPLIKKLNLKLFASDATIKEGLLSRKGKSGWSEVWMKLTRQKAIVCKPKDKSQKEILDLNYCLIGNSADKPHCFVLSMSNGGVESFAAGSAEECAVGRGLAQHRSTGDAPVYGFSQGNPFIHTQSLKVRQIAKLLTGRGSVASNQGMSNSTSRSSFAEEESVSMREVELQKENVQLRQQLAQARARIVELERRLRDGGEEMVVAKYKYEAIAPSQISLAVGDHLKVTAKTGTAGGPGWWEGISQRTGDKGLFPSNYVKKSTKTFQEEYDQIPAVVQSLTMTMSAEISALPHRKPAAHIIRVIKYFAILPSDKVRLSHQKGGVEELSDSEIVQFNPATRGHWTDSIVTLNWVSHPKSLQSVEDSSTSRSHHITAVQRTGRNRGPLRGVKNFIRLLHLLLIIPSIANNKFQAPCSLVSPCEFFNACRSCYEQNRAYPPETYKFKTTRKRRSLRTFQVHALVRNERSELRTQTNQENSRMDEDILMDRGDKKTTTWRMGDITPHGDPRSVLTRYILGSIYILLAIFSLILLLRVFFNLRKAQIRPRIIYALKRSWLLFALNHKETLQNYIYPKLWLLVFVDYVPEVGNCCVFFSFRQILQFTIYFVLLFYIIDLYYSGTGKVQSRQSLWYLFALTEFLVISLVLSYSFYFAHFRCEFALTYINAKICAAESSRYSQTDITLQAIFISTLAIILVVNFIIWGVLLSQRLRHALKHSRRKNYVLRRKQLRLLVGVCTVNFALHAAANVIHNRYPQAPYSSSTPYYILLIVFYFGVSEQIPMAMVLEEGEGTITYDR